MLTVKIESDAREVQRMIDLLRQDAPIRLAKAIDRTATLARDGLRDEMRRVFVGPVPFTLNSLKLTTTKVANVARGIFAEIKIKDESDAGKGTPAIRYLQAQIYGGTRSQKSFEKQLSEAGYLPPGWVTVPGDAIQLDGNGNVPASVYRRVLSQLRVQRGIGFESRIGGANKDKKKVNQAVRRQGGRFWVGRPGPKYSTRYPLGIWFRQYVQLDETTTSVVSPMFIFVRQANYKKRYDFFGVGQRIIDANITQQLDLQYKKAIGLS